MNAARFLRAAGGVGVIAAYQLAAHHAASTPGAHGIGLALVLAPLLFIPLNAFVRSPRARLAAAALGARVRAVMARARAAHRAFRLGPVARARGLQPRARVDVRPHARSWPRAALHPVRDDGPRHAHAAPSCATRGASRWRGRSFSSRPRRVDGAVRDASIVAWSTFANYLSLPLVGRCSSPSARSAASRCPTWSRRASWTGSAPTRQSMRDAYAGGRAAM